MAIKNWVNDARYSFRRRIKRMGYTMLAIVTLSLGIGAITAIFR